MSTAEAGFLAFMGDRLPPGLEPGLDATRRFEPPKGFVEQHNKETATADPSKGFKTKAEYLDLFNKTRQATIAATAKLSEADLDRLASGRMAQFFPTVGHMLGLMGSHTLMHVGQFSVVRRKLGKPVVM